MKTNWSIKKLGEVAVLKTSRNIKDKLPYIGMEDIESNTGKFIGNPTPKQVKSSTYHFDTNMVLYGKLRPYLNKILIPNFEGHCSTELVPLAPNQQFLIREWLAMWLMLPETVSKAMSTNTGARMPRADTKKMMGFEIPVPPIDEQKRIVKKLEEIMTKIEEGTGVRQKSLNETSRILETTLNKTFNNKQLSSKKKLSTVAKRVGGGTPSRSKKEYFEGHIPWFTVTDLPENDGRLITVATPRQFITEDAIKYSATKLIPRDSVLLATRVGVGKVAIAGTDVTTNQDFSSFIPHHGLGNRFLGYFILSQKEYFDSQARGITIKGITTDVIDNLELPLPSLKEQEKIVAYLDCLSEKVQTLQKLQQEQLQDLEALKQSVLHQAFQGEL